VSPQFLSTGLSVELTCHLPVTCQLSACRLSVICLSSVSHLPIICQSSACHLPVFEISPCLDT